MFSGDSIFWGPLEPTDPVETGGLLACDAVPGSVSGRVPAADRRGRRAPQSRGAAALVRAAGSASPRGGASGGTRDR